MTTVLSGSDIEGGREKSRRCVTVKRRVAGDSTLKLADTEQGLRVLFLLFQKSGEIECAEGTSGTEVGARSRGSPARRPQGTKKQHKRLSVITLAHDFLDTGRIALS